MAAIIDNSLGMKQGTKQIAQIYNTTKNDKRRKQKEPKWWQNKTQTKNNNIYQVYSLLLTL